jgi:hypothetical protein
VEIASSAAGAANLAFLEISPSLEFSHSWNDREYDASPSALASDAAAHESSCARLGFVTNDNFSCCP